MVASVLDGKACAAAVEEALKRRIEKCLETGIVPHLAVVIVGDDPASHVYVGAKVRACQRLGIKSTHIELGGSASEDELRNIITELNNDSTIHGILIQSPLPRHMDEEALTDLIDPSKDVDGFHPVNLGRLVQSREDCLIPCTPNGVMRMLDWAGIQTEGKTALVIGRSRNVGMPQAILLASRGADATVTIAHSRTENMEQQCRQADIVVAAVGRPNMVKKSWIKDGAVVVDVGINRVDDFNSPRGYSLVGDVEKSANEVASWITPVPGGVGPMTVAMLMENTVSAAEKTI
tara:strand:- start:218 stop:1090 length:873 start_codon:yes stop_codon:yes gene_type:complete